MTRIHLGLLVVLVSAIIGCGQSGPPPYVVQGDIIYEGKPLPKGTLTLIPTSSIAKTTVVPIEAGKYSAEITEGEWTVNIQAVRETGPVIEALREAPREQYIPRKYNIESTLKITVPNEEGSIDFKLEA